MAGPSGVESAHIHLVFAKQSCLDIHTQCRENSLQLTLEEFAMGQRTKLVSPGSPLNCCKATACNLLTICINLCANVICVSQASLFDSAAGSKSLASLASAWKANRSSLSGFRFRILQYNCVLSCSFVNSKDGNKLCKGATKQTGLTRGGHLCTEASPMCCHVLQQAFTIPVARVTECKPTHKGTLRL